MSTGQRPPRRAAGRVERALTSSIRGGTPVRSAVGPAVFQHFLPAALRDGRFRPAPEPVVAGAGLEALPDALAARRAGVSATELVAGLS